MHRVLQCITVKGGDHRGPDSNAASTSLASDMPWTPHRLYLMCFMRLMLDLFMHDARATLANPTSGH